jgi:hypothetical protein
MAECGLGAGWDGELVTKKQAGVTQLVESQPSKLLVAGSSPVSRSRIRTKSDPAGRLDGIWMAFESAVIGPQ